MSRADFSTTVNWPDNKRFAFSIFDDTDLATIEKTKPVYDFLAEHGFRTTKSVWPLKGTDDPSYGGSTCDDESYLKWIYQLKESGFEIGYHMATYSSSERDKTERGLNRFTELFGQSPSAMSCHSACKENIYWGSNRLSGMNRLAYDLATRFKYRNKFEGHIENSPYFWGDLCQQQIKYVRNFVYPDINTLAACPYMPYHDPDRPYVNMWYASSEGPDINSFVKTISEINQDRLEQESGACIMYTHLACGFYENNQLNSTFVQLMKRLRAKNGWFVPVIHLLDFLGERNKIYQISNKERAQLERRWLKHKFHVGHS